MPRVKFLPSETVVEVGDDQSLLSAALTAQIAIATACGGVANCTECKIEVLSGAEHLSTMEYIEESKLGNVFYLTHERLACQTRVCGPVTVRVLKEQLPDKRARARERALRRTRESQARRAARTSDDVRRRLALLNDDGDGDRDQRLVRGRGPEAPASAPILSKPDPPKLDPPKRRRRRRRPRPAGPKPE